MDAAKALQPAGAVYHCMDENGVKRVLKYKLTMVGSDSSPNDPHPPDCGVHLPESVRSLLPR